MRESRRVVVPFERPASYWAARARRHDTPARRPDAVRLMRKALEKSGDPHLALELFRMYADLECHTAAERCLAVAARGGLTGEICFGAGCCALNRGDERLAERALEQSLRLSPQGIYAEQAQELLETYPWQNWDIPPRGARGEALLSRSQRAMAAGDLDQALFLAKRAWKKSRFLPIALLLGALLPPNKALLPLKWACRKTIAQQQPFLMLALACHRCALTDEAYQALTMAYLLCGSFHQVEKFCLTAWEMGLYDLPLSLVEMRLAASPASADLLRLKYLCLMHAGQTEKASRTLSALLELDPDDGSALRYKRHPESVQLYPHFSPWLQILAGKIYALPPRLKPGPLNRILHMTVMALYPHVDASVIYRLLCPIWQKLSPAERKACDEERHPHYPLSFSLYILLRTGHFDLARDMLSRAPGKKRALRTLRRYMQWMKKE